MGRGLRWKQWPGGQWWASGFEASDGVTRYGAPGRASLRGVVWTPSASGVFATTVSHWLECRGLAMLDCGELGVEAGLSQGSSQSDLSEPRFDFLIWKMGIMTPSTPDYEVH